MGAGRVLVVPLGVALAAPLPLSTAALSQPAPSFTATCEGLRGALAALDWDGETLVTVRVEGPLRVAETQSGLAFLGVCEAPDMAVLCVTYALEGRAAGDAVAVVGAIRPEGPDHLVLDPCLAHPPGERP